MSAKKTRRPLRRLYDASTNTLSLGEPQLTSLAALTEIRNVVLLFSNPVWTGVNTVPTTIIRNITALSSQIAYEERVTCNITTLSTTNADAINGLIQGLLYVPDISRSPACDAAQYDYIPRNVTRRANLPPTNYNLIAIAPWFSQNCTQAYLLAARSDPIRGFIFYLPNDSYHTPDADAPVWSLDDSSWKKQNQFPVFAVSGQEGVKMTTELSYYSGNVNQTPHGTEIMELYGPNNKDYVRIWTELSVKNPDNIPSLWIFFLIVIGALLAIIGGISLTMHLVQGRRRKSLRRRVESGEVDLEAIGIKRLTVPAEHVRSFPLFTYNQDPDVFNEPSAPSSPGARGTSRSAKSCRKSRRHEQRALASDPIPPSTRSVRSIRSKRSNIAGSDTTATNFQPKCHICLDPFEHRTTVIRELSCGHIFHPECIEEFLIENSSLCPVCKHCMLPRGYSPTITNGMVRRERALRRLRERVDLDYSSLESGESKMKGWGKRLFNSSTTAATSPDVPMTSINGARPDRGSAGKQMIPISNPTPTGTSSTATTINVEDPDSGLATETPVEASQTPVVKRPRPRRPRGLRLLPTQPEDDELETVEPTGRHSPSSFARERMREIASKNAPFDDPDQQRPQWRRVISSIFPGFT